MKTFFPLWSHMHQNFSWYLWICYYCKLLYWSQSCKIADGKHVVPNWTCRKTLVLSWQKEKSIHLEIGPVRTNRYWNTSTILYHTSGWEVWGGPSGNLHVFGWNSSTLDTIEKYIKSILLSSSSSIEQTVKRQRPIVEKRSKNMYRF